MKKNIFIFLTLILLFTCSTNTKIPKNDSDDIVNQSPAQVEREFARDLVLVEGGSFIMGSNTFYIEQPAHKVTVKSFYIGRYEVTQKQWQAIMGNNPSNFKGDDLPVETIHWYDAIEYCNKLSQIEGLTPCYSGFGSNIECNFNANGYRLPTEAEWEYAAMGGNKSQGYEYSGSNSIEDVGWNGNTSERRTHNVGQKKPNELGIYDMSGNVAEWCWDWFDRYSGLAQVNPEGPSSGLYRILRGSSWNDSAKFCYVGDRTTKYPNYGDYNTGLRLVRSIMGDDSSEIFPHTATSVPIPTSTPTDIPTPQPTPSTAHATETPIQHLTKGERIMIALARIDLHLLMHFNFSIHNWPQINAVHWPTISICQLDSDLSIAWSAMVADLNQEDLESVMKEAEKLIDYAKEMGLYISAVEIAYVIAQYSKSTNNYTTQNKLEKIITELRREAADSPEFQGESVSSSFLAIKPDTLFVGTIEKVRKLGIAEIEVRFVNMLETVAEDMLEIPGFFADLKTSNKPTAFMTDYWVMVQRMRIDIAKLACAISGGDLEQVVKQVPNFNGTWGIVRGIVIDSYSPVSGAYPTW